MAFGIVQHGNGSISVNTPVEAGNANFSAIVSVTSGNFFYLIFTTTGIWIGPGGGRGSFILTDTQGNNWKFLAPAGPINQYVNVFFCEGIIGGPIVITLGGLLDLDGNQLWQGTLTYQFFEATGVNTSFSFNSQNSWLFPSGPDVGTLSLDLATTLTDVVIITFAVGSTVPANLPAVLPGSESTLIDSVNPTALSTLILEYRVVSAPGTYAATCSWSGSTFGAASIIYMAGFQLGPGAGMGAYNNIIVAKEVFPVGIEQGFDFAASWGDDFTLGPGQIENSGFLDPGTYSVVETPVSPFTTTTSQDPSAIVLGINQSIVIVFRNSAAIIIVRKVTVPIGAPDSFDFTTDYGSPFSLVSGESNISAPLAAGSYSVVEAPSSWFLTTSQDPSSITVAAGDEVIITFTNYKAAPIPARLLPYLKIPTGQGQSVNELDGQSSISSLEIQCVDPSNELKYLATKPSVIGMMAYLKMGFDGMNLSDFVPLHTVQISDLGRTADGWIRFTCRDCLALLDRALWFCGGPQPVALPWLYGQTYLAGQFVQDSNGNIEQCVVAGTTSTTQPPVWPGTPAPPWQPNTSYTLGYWATDSNGNLQQLTSVPSGSTSTRPLNTGQSGNGFPNPSWATTLGTTTVDNSGGTGNGPITWTLIAINDVLEITVSDGTVTWEIVAKPFNGIFGGSQAFYVYSLYGQTIQTPEPPARYAFASNKYPTVDGNPRYIYGNPIDALLVALQNELGLGQDPSLPPIVTTDPNDPQNALVFAPNPAWQQYLPGSDATLINPNPFLNLANIISIRDNEAAGRKFEWAIKRPVTAKAWIQEEILKPLGLYLYVHNDGTLDLKSMKSPANPAPTAIDSNTIDGIPDQTRLPIVNVVTVRGDVNDEGAYSAARVYDAEMTFAQQTSLATYLQEFSNSVESNGMREAYDSYGVGYILANRIFRRHAFATPEYTVKCFLGWVRLEIGDFITLTHPLMVDFESQTGQVGIVGVLCEIVDRQPDYENGTVTLKVWDTRFMQLSKPYNIALLADAIPDWPSMTPAQKAKYMVVSYWPGFYSDGTDGNVIY